MEEAPQPLVPPDVDLRGLEYMPLFGLHLFGSEFNAASSDSEWRAAITLWWASWNQVPAGSLPDDDVALCRLADLGRDVKTWRKLRDRALHGFVKCSDGRLYHSFLCKQVLIAWDKRVQERERKRKWRERNKGQNADGDGDKTGTGTRTETGTEHGQNADVPADVTRRDVTGRDGNSVVMFPIPEEVGENACAFSATAPAGEDKTEAKKNGAPYEKIVSLYHEKLPELPKVAKLTNTRRGYIRQRWLEDLPDISAWSEYFAIVRQSKFLMGLSPGSNGRPPFRASLDWLCRPENIAKVIEGKYHRG